MPEMGALGGADEKPRSFGDWRKDVYDGRLRSRNDFRISERERCNRLNSDECRNYERPGEDPHLILLRRFAAQI
jgi:hypothetical protein